MPFNGSGTFLRVRNWVNNATAGIRIRADFHDSEDDNLASGLSQCITRDGQTTITGNLPMSGFRHTGVGEATQLTQYARYDQMSSGKSNWKASTGTGDAIIAAYDVPTITLADGQLFYFRATAANTTNTPTFSPDGLTARNIVKRGGQTLSIGDIPGAGAEVILRYNMADTRYELLNPASLDSGGDNNFSGDNTFNGKVLFSDDGELTISSGEITVTGVYHTVDTESDDATDDLETINGGADGQILVLRAEDDARNVVIKTTGNSNPFEA